MQELKGLRGHKEQAKTQCVALSFCLWGDPEVRPFPQGVKRPGRAAVAVCWEAADRLSVVLPSRRLPAVQAGLFEARLFPGSETADMLHPQRRMELLPRLAAMRS